MKTLNFLLAACLITTAAFAEELSWSTLASRPELWPTQCTMKQSIQFEGDAGVQAGQKVDVLKITAGEVEVVTTDGQVSFAASPEETDVLTVARQTYAALTPKQRELTYASIVGKKELWPKYVTLKESFNLGGQTVSKGDRMLLMNVENGALLVMAEKLNTKFQVVPQATDLMAQARTFVEDKQASGRKFIEDQYGLVVDGVIAELDGKLISSATGQPQPLDVKSLPRYIVFYRGSSTCPITRQFTPQLVKFYNQMKPQHPEFEIVYMMTESVADTNKFAKELGFSWRAVEYESTATMPTAAAPISGLLPQLIVMDRTGKVLANGSQATAPKALDQLTALLNKPAQK